jgi:hypothetical protein
MAAASSRRLSVSSVAKSETRESGTAPSLGAPLGVVGAVGVVVVVTLAVVVVVVAVGAAESRGLD